MEHFCLSAVCCRLPEITMFQRPSTKLCFGSITRDPKYRFRTYKFQCSSCLASSSAISFPGTLLWPGTRSKCTTIKSGKFTECQFSFGHKTWSGFSRLNSAFSAAWLWEHIVSPWVSAIQTPRCIVKSTLNIKENTQCILSSIQCFLSSINQLV